MIYNVGSGWNYSQFSGSWMIRPVFNYHHPLINSNNYIHHTEVSEFTMFPHPLVDYTTLYFDSNQYRKIIIRNLLGQTMRSIDSFSDHIVLYREDLPSGMYFIEMLDGSLRIVQRLLVK